MVKHNQKGEVSATLISLIFAVIFLLGAIGFGVWAFSSRQDFKDNVDAKVDAAVEIAKKEEALKKTAEFNEASKLPFKVYSGPEEYGSLQVSFPKTWSGYVDDAGKGASLVDGYFAPNTVPSATDENSTFALRIKVVDQSYAQVLKSFSSQQQAGKATVTAYSLPKLPKIVGVQATGEVTPSKETVTMVVLPLRSSTLQIWTEGTQYLNDFNNNILPNFSFTP